MDWCSVMLELTIGLPVNHGEGFNSPPSSLLDFLMGFAILLH